MAALRRASGCKPGFSLLETMLALALASTFLTAFFAIYSGVLRTFVMASNARGGMTDASDTLNRIVRSIERARASSIAIAKSNDGGYPSAVYNEVILTDQSGDVITYELVSRNLWRIDRNALQQQQQALGFDPPAVRSDVVIHYSRVGATNETGDFGPYNLIANLNPHGANLVDTFSNEPVSQLDFAQYVYRDLSNNYTYSSSNSNTGGVALQLALQANPDSPVNYLHVVAFVRAVSN